MRNKTITYTLDICICHFFRQMTSVACALLALAATLTACSSSEDEALLPPAPPVIPDPTQNELPVTFNIAMAETQNSTTRAALQGSALQGSEAAEKLGGSFVVDGYKFTSGTDNYGPQAVFAQTPVTYIDGTAGSTSSNTAGWDYVDEDNNQFIRYWDQAAFGYVFWAYAPKELTGGVTVESKLNDDKVSASIKFSNLKGGAKAPTSSAYMSLPTIVNPTSAQVQFQGATTLNFQQPLARIRIGFLSGEDDLSMLSPKELHISEVEFAPAVTSPLITIAGGVIANYSWSNSPTTPPQPNFTATAIYSTTTSAASGSTLDTLEFNNYKAYADEATCYAITEDHYVENALYVYATETGDGDGKVTAASPEDKRIEKQWFYVFPENDPKEWRLSIKTEANGIETDKTAIIPATYMKWQPNHQYTYIFKVSPGNVDLSIVGVDVEVIGWKPGGTTEDVQHNW